MDNKKTKCNIYYEKGDNKSVYIEINDLSDCCFEIWDIDGKTESRAKIKIPLKQWKTMLKRWALSNVKEDDSYEYI